AKDLIGKPIFELISPDERKRIKQFVADRIKGRSVNSHYQTRGLKKDGTEFDMEVNVAQYGQKDIKNTLVILRDVTDRNRLEEQLRQSQKMESIGNLAGGIAHDFNNLLFPILGMSEMLLEDLPQDSLEYENAQEIFIAGKRAGALVQQILAFSRQSEHKMTPVKVQNVLKEVLKLSRSTIPTNIEIQQNIQQNCGLVMADPTQVHQVAMNLITNAFHAVEEKNGTIDIKLKEVILKDNELPNSVLKSGQFIRLSVSDNGIGMSQSTVQKIFEPYFTTKEQGKGTGLGLAVVYGIVKEHGGDIKVYSEMGKGSTFSIYLPLMTKSSQITPAENVEMVTSGTENILLVDDEVSVAKLEGQMLARLGYQTTIKTNSVDALSAFKKNPEFFDLVISDMTMPGMTGDQLADEILSIKPDTPIIICTGFSERINKELAETSGVKGFLMKPVVKLDMAQMVRKVLDEAIQNEE
ncbi:MAG: response regulator, partial [Desulfobacteraceae bacterium]|nr:response regulator [Desulfobacteraceae bacterium]